MNKNNNTNQVFPVIHHLDERISIEQAELAFREGADGVFLISHERKNKQLYSPAQIIKSQYPEKIIGFNLLGDEALDALALAVDLGIDALWTDTHGVTSQLISQQAEKMAAWITNNPQGPQIYASVAFKYQTEESDPGEAARRVSDLGMIATTSGPGTGYAPDLDKIKIMKQAVGKRSLAVASGMTPENAHLFLPYVSHYFVATGVSLDEYHFDELRLRKFISIIKGYASHQN